LLTIGTNHGTLNLERGTPTKKPDAMSGFFVGWWVPTGVTGSIESSVGGKFKLVDFSHYLWTKLQGAEHVL
jgi:hypothetical protein